jgi:hypothetical protein
VLPAQGTGRRHPDGGGPCTDEETNTLIQRKARDSPRFGSDNPSGNETLPCHANVLICGQNLKGC